MCVCVCESVTMRVCESVLGIYYKSLIWYANYTVLSSELTMAHEPHKHTTAKPWLARLS